MRKIIDKEKKYIKNKEVIELENYSKLKNEYYEIIFPIGYEEDIKEILDYSTNKLLDNLNFFNQV